MKKYFLYVGIFFCTVLCVILFTSSSSPPETEIKQEIPKINWQSNLTLIEKPLSSTTYEERKENQAVTHVVLHFISDATNRLHAPYEIDAITDTLENYGVSAHYLIDRNGTLYMLVPEDKRAYHAGKGTLVDYPSYENELNGHSIGIEIMGIGTKEEMSIMLTESDYGKLNFSDIGFTDAQYVTINELLDDITKRHILIKKNRNHIIGHDEYSPLKTDPGSLFDWTKIGLQK